MLKDITVIVPLHKYDEDVETRLSVALNSVVENQKSYEHNVSLLFVSPKKVAESVSKLMSMNEYKSLQYKIVENKGNTDFQSQINLAVNSVETSYFSILEYDDTYHPKWFSMASSYVTEKEESVLLPVNVINDGEKTIGLINEIAWSSAFSENIGYLDLDALLSFENYNITGGIFNTSDFVKVGGLKSSLSVTFGYELLLRMAYHKLDIFVVPKEGYRHRLGGVGTLSHTLSESMTEKDVVSDFERAKIEYVFTDDKQRSNTKGAKAVELK